MKLSQAVVVITGGTKGLGKSLAEGFLKQGAQVVVSARSVVGGGENGNPQAWYISGDVTKETDIQHLADEVVDRYGQIDIWINNAGIWLPKMPIATVDMEQAHAMMEVNLFGTVYGSRVALAQMSVQNHGTILNIISNSALSGRPYSALYCASKFAADGFTKSLRLEAKDQNIQVLAVYPGGIKTHLFDAAKPENYDAYMEPEVVVTAIVNNLLTENPVEELILERPNK